MNSNNKSLSWLIAILSPDYSYTYVLYYQQKTDGNGMPQTNEGQKHSNSNLIPTHRMNLINPLVEWHLRTNWTIEDRCPWTASNKISKRNICGSNHTNPFKQQFIFLTHSHVINRIEQHLQSKLSEEYGLQWTAGKKWGTNAFQAHFLDKSFSTTIRFPDL